MSTSLRPRNAFAPDALAKLSVMVDDAWNELSSEGGATQAARIWLAKKIFALARYPWTEIQMKQLLLRAFRNETTRLRRGS
jgi:hypothetical protein